MIKLKIGALFCLCVCACVRIGVRVCRSYFSEVENFIKKVNMNRKLANQKTDATLSLLQLGTNANEYFLHGASLTKNYKPVKTIELSRSGLQF